MAYLFRIFDQAQRNKILESRAERAFETRRTRLRNQEQHFHGMVFGEWRLPFGEFDRGDSERPDVGFGVVSGLTDHLGCHPVGSADKSVATVKSRGELSRYAKVGCIGEVRWIRGRDEMVIPQGQSLTELDFSGRRE